MAAAAFRGGSCWQRRRRLAPLVVVVVVVLLALVVGPVAGAYKKYLFLDDLESQVEELVGAAELDRVKERREPYAVMFYSPSCPHCT